MSVKIYLTGAAQRRMRAELADDIDRLEGRPPYNRWSNHCYADPYFAQSILRKAGGADSIEDVKKWLRQTA